MSLGTMRGMLLVLVLLFTQGCCWIGIETIGSHKAEVYQARADNFSVWRNNDAVYNFEISSPESGPAGTNQSARLYSPSTNDIISLLGAPSEQGTNYLRYRTGKWAWHGIAIDLAIFPIPLTIPLMVPGGKTGYVDFVFDKSGTNLVRYGPLSKFYGYAANDKDSGFRWGWDLGIWFNPNP